MALRTDNNLRAGLYARVSTEDRGQDPETQLRPLREYAERRGFALVGERVKAGMTRAKAQGKRTSRPPIPEATRRKIAELHGQGMSIKRIAKSWRSPMGQRGIILVSYQHDQKACEKVPRAGSLNR